MSFTVSVVTVCRNSANTIAASLRSVAAQTCPAIEHIVIDGASGDGTQQLVAEMLRSGGQIISEPDTGIYNAMNKGWRLAKGDYVAFLNADDHYASSDAIARLMRVAEADSVDIVCGNVRYFYPERPNRFVRRYNSGIFRPSLLRWGMMPAHPGMLMRRDLLLKLGGFREDFAIAADFDLCVRAFIGERCRYRCVPISVVNMAMGGASTRNLAAKFSINREVVQACRDNGLYSNRFMIMAKYPLKLLETVNPF